MKRLKGSFSPTNQVSNFNLFFERAHLTVIEIIDRRDKNKRGPYQIEVISSLQYLQNRIFTNIEPILHHRENCHKFQLVQTVFIDDVRIIPAINRLIS